MNGSQGSQQSHALYIVNSKSQEIDEYIKG